MIYLIAHTNFTSDAVAARTTPITAVKSFKLPDGATDDQKSALEDAFLDLARYCITETACTSYACGWGECDHSFLLVPSTVQKSQKCSGCLNLRPFFFHSILILIKLTHKHTDKVSKLCPTTPPRVGKRSHSTRCLAGQQGRTTRS